jgi:hypothetical protein
LYPLLLPLLILLISLFFLLHNLPFPLRSVCSELELVNKTPFVSASLDHFTIYNQVSSRLYPCCLEHLNQLTDFHETRYEHYVRSRCIFVPFNSLTSVPTRLMRTSV